MRLIDADVLFKCFERAAWYNNRDRDDIAEELLLQQPTIEAEPVKHGYWEEWWPEISVIMTGEEMLYCCSNCTAKYADIEDKRYCPNCGCKMDLEEA